MSWANCGVDQEGRPIGYSVDAGCDHPGCKAKIDRGLSYVCGGMHGGGAEGGGKYFCPEHLHVSDQKQHALCRRCWQAGMVERLHKELRPEAAELAQEPADASPQEKPTGILDLAAYKRRKEPVSPAAEIREESIAKARTLVSSLESGEATGFLLIVQMKEGAPRFQAGGELSCADGLWLIEQLKKQLLNG